MPTIISIVGNSDSGKTTLIEKLVPELKSRGYRVATAKHTPHGMTFDQPGKDSWRHIQAGSEATVISSPDKLVLVRPVTGESTLDDIGRFFGEEYDIILAEGFKQDSAPKIVVHRKEGGPPLSDVKRLVAVVTDEVLNTRARQFSPDDLKGLVDLLEKGLMQSPADRMSLYVNKAAVPLSAFPREMITNVLVSLVTSLKGVAKISSLELFLKKPE